MVPADPTHLERVVENLLENALERTPAGGAVVVRATEEPEALLWQVEDGGSTIGPDVCANLFVKWDPTNDALPSAALRLHFCRIVAENCGGEIGCQSLPAGGNCFWIRLTKGSASA
jgi:two-component system sensor histidine kinase CreC